VHSSSANSFKQQVPCGKDPKCMIGWSRVSSAAKVLQLQQGRINAISWRNSKCEKQGISQSKSLGCSVVECPTVALPWIHYHNADNATSVPAKGRGQASNSAIGISAVSSCSCTQCKGISCAFIHEPDQCRGIHRGEVRSRDTRADITGSTPRGVLSGVEGAMEGCSVYLAPCAKISCSQCCNPVTCSPRLPSGPAPLITYPCPCCAG
jgi:hypothetical protein